MLFIAMKRVFKTPLAQILNSQCVAPKVLSNCRLRMIPQNQFEYSSLRPVSMPMAESFGPTELHTFNNTFAPITTLSLSLPSVQNLIVRSPIPLMLQVYIPFGFRVPFITQWEAFCLLPVKDLDLHKFISMTQLKNNYNSVTKLIRI